MPNGLEIKDEGAFRDYCLSRLRKVFEAPGLRFTKGAKARATWHLYDSEAEQVPIREGGPVLPLHRGSLQSFWLALSIDVDHPRAVTLLEHVTLQVRVGGVSDPDKRLWMRAEWDTRKSDAGHAQPHWHVSLDYNRDGRVSADLSAVEYQQFLEAEAELLGGDEESDSEGGLAPLMRPTSKWFQSLSDFHYAMSVEWVTEKEVDAWRMPSSGLEVARWIERCVRYIRHQLEYCERSIPNSQKTAAN